MKPLIYAILALCDMSKLSRVLKSFDVFLTTVLCDRNEGFHNRR